MVAFLRVLTHNNLRAEGYPPSGSVLRILGGHRMEWPPHGDHGRKHETGDVIQSELGAQRLITEAITFLEHH